MLADLVRNRETYGDVLWTPLIWMTAVAIRMFWLASPSRQPAQGSLSLRSPKDV